MTEEKMFINIFNYIEHLYGKIRPKKLFFMAIDGVAPRAKMNQQRARRFRTALDAERAREKAVREGVEMPSEDAFDSNCITPGTEFMAKLTKQLKYFINKKISEDADWQGVDIVLSGHEVPGEGEHKIMEYIRLAKAQPDYDANIRHCLYGLDADLIMLGLLSHDPHFCLLREEVSFGNRNKEKKSKELEHQNFYLLHLCIVREYLELEFQGLKAPGIMKCTFDMERIIDDFILMAFFVGNDFLPNLPHLHINEGALALMFKIYQTVLPKAGGYINERGVINLERLGILLDELSRVEYRFFEAENADASWFKGKQIGKADVMEKEVKNKSGPLTFSTAQRDIYRKVKQYIKSHSHDPSAARDSLDLSPNMNAADRKFTQDLVGALHLEWKTEINEDGDRRLKLWFPARLEGDDEEEGEDEEASIALRRVLKHYDNATITDVSAQDTKFQLEKKYEEKFSKWKDVYYKSKFEWGLDNEEEMRKLTENYVQGLQWVLYYYYRGVASWPWFYGYHYSPMISDVKQGLRADMNFELGQPFRPFQQLMGVLPDRSKKIVPTPYHELMTSSDSPIYDFYPRDFELDMNGKKMDWEAVVKIPFIDETRLLRAMSSKHHMLSEDENERNDFGVSLKFTYGPDVEYVYGSSLVGIFPDIPRSHCVENIFDLPTMEGLDYHVGLMRGVMLGESALYGFPSLNSLPFFGSLDFHGVSVFQQDSRNESMIITLLETEARTTITCAKRLLGRKVHVGYPYLSEAKVMSVSDEMFNYSLPPNGQGPPIAAPHGPQELQMWHKKATRIENTYSKRLGTIIGDVQSLVHVDTLKGLKKTDDGATIKEYAQIPGIETDYAAQAVVENVPHEDQRFIEKAALPVEEEFPIGSRAFFLGDYNYGRPLEVVGHTGDKIDIWVSTAAAKVPEFGRKVAADADNHSPYTPSYAVARVLGLNPLVLSKITSSFSVVVEKDRVNLGLNLKFEAKKLKVLGYSRRNTSGWEFSEKAIELVRLYMMKFPEFIAGIQRKPQGDLFEPTDFYPASEAYLKIKQIQTWLKEISSKNFEKVPLDAEQLDSVVVHRLEEEADKAFQLDPPGKGVNKKIKGAPRNALMRPSDAEQRLNHQRFSLGDRVVYVQDSGRVPIATRGTVIGKTRTTRTTLLDVVFDVTFMSGTSLDDRCSPFRGSTVPLHTVLNLTDRQLTAGSKAEDSHRRQPQSQPLSTSGFPAPAGMHGQGQLKPAAAPLPLRGSFRRAVAGTRGMSQAGVRGDFGHANSQSAHHSLPIRSGLQGTDVQGQSTSQTEGVLPRGRGAQQLNVMSSRGRGNSALTRGGYHRIDDGLLDWRPQNNPSFRPKSYSNVPPPAMLESRGRGNRGGRGSPSRGIAPRGSSGPQSRAIAVVVQQQ
ncbi:uncharacterized protein KY384_005275 [Bacidia gigantensis]|uniref:uncharacterized protein n=1 Tax=Bacidia gigantensis TaxID=2732470 RepID=UPI001D0510D9|nr:uncharacterized protein KY384_005275 [Bacidia gigantensis]KAG8529794.1 hypothetical protein KY384_005275 [Bacidia gigantensis]